MVAGVGFEPHDLQVMSSVSELSQKITNHHKSLDFMGKICYY